MSAAAKIERWRNSSGVSYNNVVQVVQQVMTDEYYATPGSNPFVEWGTGTNVSYPYNHGQASPYETFASAYIGGGGWWIVPNFVARIKPRLLTSKIVVMLDLIYGCSYWEVQGRITRNGIAIGLGDQRDSRFPCTFSDNNFEYTSGPQYSQYSTYKASVILVDDPWGSMLSNGTDNVTTAGPISKETVLEYAVELNTYNGNSFSINRPYFVNNDSDYYGEPISTLTLLEVTE